VYFVFGLVAISSTITFTLLTGKALGQKAPGFIPNLELRLATPCLAVEQSTWQLTASDWA
jgi:hypothetical protein